MSTAPKPFTFKSADKFWSEDPFERFLPRTPGFISDFVSSLRGNEVPVAYSMWCAVMALSSALKRETWLDWHPTLLYPNFYLILVGPAGEAHKGVVIGQMSWVLDHMQEYVEQYNVRIMKEMKIFEDKITSEGLAKFLKKFFSHGMKIQYVDADGKGMEKDGKPLCYHKTSEMTIIAEELGTLLSRARYNEDLITNLTALYNTKERGGELTVKRGKVSMPNLFTNLIGGTTPDAFRDSIPKTALNEGFISRLIICYQKNCVQIFRKPIVFGLDREELASRLAWIAEHTVGAWELSPESDKAYDKWYNQLRTKYDYARFHPAQRSRFSVHLLKLALIFAAQRYDSHMKPAARIIDIEAFKDAVAFLEATMETAPAVIVEVEESPFVRTENRIISYIEGHKRGVKRATLMQNFHFSAEEVTRCIADLYNGNRIMCLSDEKKDKGMAHPPQHNGRELYVLKDGKDEDL